MSDSVDLYCRGYGATPIIEACRSHGLFGKLDVKEFRRRDRLIVELRANPAYLTVALEGLVLLGWLERNGTDAYRKTSRAADDSFDLELTALYALEPRDLLASGDALVHRIEASLQPEHLQNTHASALVLGAIVPPLCAALAELNPDRFSEELRQLDVQLAAAIEKLFVHHGWLSADEGRLTAAGKQLMQAPEFAAVLSYRQLLYAAENLLFGETPEVGRDAGIEIKLGNVPGNLNGWQPQEQQPVVVADIACVEETSAELISALNSAAESKDSVDAAVRVLAAKQPAFYLDDNNELLSGASLLHRWQRRLSILAQHAADAPFAVLASHAIDAPRLLARQHPIGADTFVVLAASVGLFNDTAPQRHPGTPGTCQATLHHFRRRKYSVRNAVDSDLDRLCELEKLCWQHTRTSKQQIRARLQKYPQGQFVLEEQGKVLGVVYSQRIASVELLDECTAANVHSLHQEAGSIIQLLAINIDPRVQDRGYGDQLLEFMLQRCSLVADVTHVVGVTLCKSYDADSCEPFEQYLRRGAQSQDPVLAFHQSHGAQVVKAMPGYRPQDVANQGNGVLVLYDALKRVRPRVEASAASRISPQQLSRFIEDSVIQLAGIDRENFQLDRPLMESGLDSADLLKLQLRLEEKLDRKLPTGFFFQHNTSGKVIAHLTARPASSVNREAPADVRVANRATSRNDTDIAIVGVSCKLPGGIETPEQLWRVLASATSVISSFPAARGAWPSSSIYPAIDRGGFVHDADAFDAGFFRMSPAEAAITDPQQRMLLQLAWSCLEEAGIVPGDVQGSNTGVFIGASNCDYSRLLQDAGLEVQAHHGVASSLAILANRLSYFFDFSGPSLVIDTACSSSLVALHTAMQSLRSGECTAALVGGVNLICHPDLSIAYHKAGMLARDGQCKVFDAAANGYVRSEGAVMMLLKPLHLALAGGDRIHAVIKGSAVNHGGLAGGLTVPNPQKQAELLTAAWKNAGVGAQDLSYIEAHGTGTSLGDPIEIEGIQAAASQASSCAIGSIKSNLGHLEPAAGLAGLLKLLLCLRHRQIPASINFSQLNPKIRLGHMPFRIQQTLTSWDAAYPRTAAVSSFGSGGANAHAIIQEYSTDNAEVCDQDSHLFVLSAASDECLRDYVSQVIRWLQDQGPNVSFASAIYTWQVGRAAMKQRLAMKIMDAKSLQDRLQRWLDGDASLPDTWHGQASAASSGLNRIWQTKSGQQLVTQALQERDLEQLGVMWTSGAHIDWRKLAGNSSGSARRVSLPTYPFAKERYWIESTAAAPTSAESSRSLHPMVHINSSDLYQHSYRSRFSGQEFFLADHRVALEERNTQSVLPGVAYLEMIRAAVDHALPGRRASATLELRDTLWLQPLVVSEKSDVSIALAPNDDDRIEFEIHSLRGGEDIAHCQGTAQFTVPTTMERLALESLKAQMDRAVLDTATVYSAMNAMGLVYGPAHRSIVAIRQGERQLLAQLRLPASAERSRADYVLHPSLMDGALQAAVGLVEGWQTTPAKPRLPFALERLLVVADCSNEMWAWVRHSSATAKNDQLIKLDIDLCDEHGNICVQMRGFSLRVPKAATSSEGTVLSTPMWQPAPVRTDEPDCSEHHVFLCELPWIDSAALQEKIPEGRCQSLQPLPDETLAERYSKGARECFKSVQTILRAKASGKSLLQVVLAAHDDHTVFSGLSALLRTAALENPQLVGQVIVTRPQVAADELLKQLLDGKARSREAVIRYDSRGAEVLRWQDVAASSVASHVVFKDHGTYLITGGLGGLGQLFAREIIEQTRHATVILTGRGPLDAHKQSIMEKLGGTSGRLQYRALDLSDLQQAKQTIAAVEREHSGLDGILHCAGRVADNFIFKKTLEEFGEVLAPKVSGTFNLDQATADIELDFLVLFSSVVAATGNLGQADYAAANGFMDAFAAYRNEQVSAGRRHGRTLAINWPLWIEGGMRLEPAAQMQFQHTTGMRPLSTASGLKAFYRCLALSSAQVWVKEAAPEPETLAQTATTVAEPEQPRSADAATWPEQVQDYLRKQLSSVLKLPSHKIDAQAALESYGIDSIMAVDLARRLEQDFGPLAKTLLFEYRSIRELAKYFIESHATRLAQLLAPTATTGVIAAPIPAPKPAKLKPLNRARTQPVRATNDEPIAIIGLSGRYPQAENIEAYWRNLRDGKDCIVEVPSDRWDWHEYFSEDRTATGRHFSRWGGFIAGVDEFDPVFFNIAPRDAKFIDPQERLFLQHAWMAVEDAGYTRASLQTVDSSGEVGVYAGVMWSEYQLFGARSSASDLRMGFAGNLASIANRVSYTFDLHGPSMTLDTMCSSSLTAIHVACQDLRQGRTQVAIAGGVNVSVHPHKYTVLSAGQFISSDGHCQSFGEGGDGYIPGEGVGVVILKRLSDAQRDGDHIYGVIRGSALNHGGKTNGYTVPNPQAQSSAINRALTESGIDVRQIGYIEAHGTGTKLGDPIEIAALSKAFQQHSSQRLQCLIGSAKSNIGHCESAAGIAGLTKVLLQLRHRQVVASLHSSRLNPHIDFEQTPFVVNQQLRDWDAPVIDGRALPRVAGISSFGAGGSNAHMIVEEYVAPTTTAIERGGPVAIPISARTAAQLQQKARDLLAHLDAHGSEPIDLVAMAYTLQTGREAMEERLGLLVSSVEQLRQKLQTFVTGDSDIEGLHRGQVKRNKEVLATFATDSDWQQTLDSWIARGKLTKLMELWANGLDFDWGKLHGSAKPLRMSLPTYPFAKDRYWIDVSAPAAPTRAGAVAAVLHPLLHRNTSDLNEHRYSSTFSGEEFFVRAAGNALPSVCYLEMARAAIEHAMPKSQQGGQLELRQLAWGPALAIAQPTEVNIVVFASQGEELAFEIYSEAGAAEIIHCQGRASFHDEPIPARVHIADMERQMKTSAQAPAHQAITAVFRGEDQLLAKLRVPESIAMGDEFELHPGLMEGVQEACVGLITDWRLSSNTPPQLVSIDSLRIVGPCGKEMIAWVRQLPDTQLAVDLCDEAGNVCVQMRGIRFTQAVASPAAIALPMVAPVVASERDKPTNITLAALTELTPHSSLATRSAPLVSLSALSAAAATAVRLDDIGNGILSIRVDADGTNNELSPQLIGELLNALAVARESHEAKVLIISGTTASFLSGARRHYNDAVEQQLYRAVATFPYPVISAMQGSASGAGLLVGLLCDFMICSEEAEYRYTDLQEGLFPGPAELAIFNERLGEARTQDLLYVAPNLSGRQLREKGWTCPILPGPEVESYARELASTLATRSPHAMRLLKQHLARHLRVLVDDLRPVAEITVQEARPNQVLMIRIDARAQRADFTIEPEHRVIVLDFDDSAAPGLSEDLARELQRFVIESQIPVIAILGPRTGSIAWLLGQFCDACIYSSEGVYRFADGELTGSLAAEAAMMFSHRFGNYFGRQIVLSGVEWSAAELQRRVGALAIVATNDMLAAALRLAQSWAALPVEILASWKHETALNLRNQLLDLARFDSESVEPQSAPELISPMPVALKSKVIVATAHPQGILVVRMEDREAKNMFSPEFVAGIREVFAHIEQTAAYRAVVLTGYDSYFASGGTRESLLAIQRGEVKFTAFDIFHLPLECPVPVIAAMQGHGIGAGWSFGMFADVVLMSDESRYISPYMEYGFTPGAGATLIFPQQVGHDLARETLFTARQYSGAELKERGLPVSVLSRNDVLPAAMEWARKFAQMSRSRLVALKRQLTTHLHRAVAETYQLELAMHEKTFVGQAETLAQISSRFLDTATEEDNSQALELESEPPAAPAVATPAPAMDTDELAVVIGGLKRLLAQELHMQEQDLDEGAQFVDLGLDSIIAVTWIRKINETYRLSLDATKVYGFPTLAQLSRHVRDSAKERGTLIVPAAKPSVVAQAPVAALVKRSRVEHNRLSPRATNVSASIANLTSWRRRKSAAPTGETSKRRPVEPIAIIGMAGQFPRAGNIDDYWRNISEGRNCIDEVPATRWNIDACYQPGAAASGKTNSRWMGALEHYDRFDPLFFNISPTEAVSMDPQQRLFLQACWHAIEHAAYDAKSLSGTRCGVFAGCAPGDYHQLASEQRLSAQGFTGSANSILAARIAYFLNLQGPCLSIDTACSSSLVAIAHACDSLLAGDSDLALAGGVALMAGPEMHIKTSQAGMLSSDGRCFTFDQRANGFVPGEAVGVVMLKRLSDAERDGDIIHAVVQGWGVNQDGKTNGITAPSPEAQARLQQYVYDKYQIDPGSIQLIEAHGTGTKLGDPIEVGGLKDAFGKYTRQTAFCALGSVKSNIGHCMAAAGVAGFIKVVLALQHRQLPPSINFERLNEHIDLTASPFYVNDKLQEWRVEGSQRRQAAISSFGFSGTNAHAVIAEYAAPVRSERRVVSSAVTSDVIVPLSARTTEELAQKARDLLVFVRQADASLDLGELAYTLQTGRQAMDERLGIIASSVEQLTDKLQAIVDGVRQIDNVHTGHTQGSRERLSILNQDAEMRQVVVDKWIEQSRLSKLLDLWVNGLDLDWQRLYGANRPRRICLPVYPFAKQRYWIATSDTENMPTRSAAAVLHPLLHENISDFAEQSYRSVFSGEEWFLSDHRVRTKAGTPQKVLPGVAYLEMARAAVAQASSQTSMELSSATVFELRNTVWLRPVVIGERRSVSIALIENDSEQIDYEIFSKDGEQETIHCQGRGVASREQAPAALDITRLQAQMTRGVVEGSRLYSVFDGMGLHYGAAHRGIVSMHLGDQQLLARLQLPSLLLRDADEYLLHPSLMDSALQASIGLIADLSRPPSEPFVPFSLERLRIISACSPQMFAWVRYAEGSRRGDSTVRVNIDVCDSQGRVCVQMLGFACRTIEASTFNGSFYRRLIDNVLNKEMSVDAAVDLG